LALGFFKNGLNFSQHPSSVMTRSPLRSLLPVDDSLKGAIKADHCNGHNMKNSLIILPRRLSSSLKQNATLSIWTCRLQPQLLFSILFYQGSLWNLSIYQLRGEANHLRLTDTWRFL